MTSSALVCYFWFDTATENVLHLAGLPRTGSRVRGEIVHQNEHSPVLPASSLSEIVSEVRARWGMDTVTLSAYKHLEQLPNIGRGIRRGMYRHCAEPVIVDNSWAWHMNDAIDSTRDKLGDETKVIWTVDDIADCLAPFSLLIDSNPESVSHIYARANVIRAQAGISRKADRGYAGSFEVVDRGVFDTDAR